MISLRENDDMSAKRCVATHRLRKQSSFGRANHRALVAHSCRRRRGAYMPSHGGVLDEETPFCFLQVFCILFIERIDKGGEVLYNLNRYKF